MRIITGDECGLLKEVIPELCRPSTLNNNNIHAGKARPSATSIQAAASSYGTNGNQQQQNGIQRLEIGHNIQSRERGIISLSFLPPPPSTSSTSEQSSEFNFAALRTNGIVETWNGTRINNNNDDEVNVTSARYKKYGGLVKGILPAEQQSSSNSQEEEKDVSGSDNDDKDSNQEKKTSTKGWYTNQPIRPIGMVSNYSTSSSSSSTTNPILATCDSIGTISLINPNKLSDGVISSYNAFDIDTSSTSTGGGSELPTPSSSKNKSNSIGTLTYTRGRYANVSIATSIAIDSSGGSGECKLAVGGRERGVRVLDLETGKLLWKAKNLPPDPQTLLQQPMWTTSIQFLYTPTSAISTDSPSNLLATGSAYKQVQIYDIRVSSGGSGGGATKSTRRPVLYTPDELLSHRITSICQLNNNGNTIAVGDTIGDVHLLDMRKMHSGKPSHRSRYNNNTSSSSSKHKAKEEIGLGRLVGPGGSIKQLYVHPTLPIISCVGLDRKLWTYDVNRHKMIDCIYLKQRLNCMLVCDDESWNVDNEEEENEEEDENGSMNVDDLEEVEDEVEDYVNSDDDEEEEEVDNGQVAKKEESKSSSDSGSSSSGEDETESESGSEEEEEEEVVSKKRRTK